MATAKDGVKRFSGFTGETKQGRFLAMSDVADLPDDIHALKAMIAAQGAQIARKDAELHQRDIEIARHEAQLRHHALMIAKLKARLSVDMYNSARRLLYSPRWERKVVSMNSYQREIQRKLRVLEYADDLPSH